MRTIPAALQTLLTDTTVTPALCHLLTVTRRNGTISRFTTWNTNLTVGGNAYVALPGLSVSAIRYKRNSPGSTVEFTVTTDDDGAALDEDVVRSGLWDHAEVIVAFCSPDLLSAGAVELWRGFCGHVELSDRFHARIQAVGLMRKADKITIPKYSEECRADFGDSRCKKNIAALKASATVASISGHTVGLSSPVSPQMKLGLLVPTSGEGVGEAFEIRSVSASGSSVKTFLQTRGRLAVGDAVDLYPGCDHSLDGAQGCVFWDNAINFRGEPFVPGDHAVRIRWTDEAIASES